LVYRHIKCNLAAILYCLKTIQEQDLIFDFPGIVTTKTMRKIEKKDLYFGREREKEKK
jgi:hypothetical protein